MSVKYKRAEGSHPLTQVTQPCHAHTTHHATMAILEDGMDDGHPTIKYAMMAAVNIMGTDPVSISDVKNMKIGQS